MTCPRCAFDNPLGIAFCGRCGTTLASLGAAPPIPPEGFAFCGGCGSLRGFQGCSGSEEGMSSGTTFAGGGWGGAHPPAPGGSS